MKIYILTYAPFPNGGMATTNRIKCYAKALSVTGIKCEIVCYKRSEIHNKINKNINSKGYYNKIPFHYIGNTTIRSSNPLIRRLNDWKDKHNAIKYLKKNIKENDIVFMYIIDDISYIKQIIKTVHKNKAKVCLELCELPFMNDSSICGDKNRQKMYTEVFPNLDYIIPISTALQDLVKPYLSPGSHSIQIPILVDFEKKELNNTSHEEKSPFIFHSGSLYERKDGILGMLKAFGIVKQKTNFPIKFISTGSIKSSPHELEISSIIQKYNIQNDVIFTGYLTDEELSNYLSKAAFVIINKYKSLQNKYCFSTKLGEYMAAAKPIILTNYGESSNWLTNNVSAKIIEAENEKQLVEAIEWMCMHPKEARIMGEQAQLICKKSFNCNLYGPILLKFFKQ